MGAFRDRIGLCLFGVVSLGWEGRVIKPFWGQGPLLCQNGVPFQGVRSLAFEPAPIQGRSLQLLKLGWCGVLSLRFTTEATCRASNPPGIWAEGQRRADFHAQIFVKPTEHSDTPAAQGSWGSPGLSRAPRSAPKERMVSSAQIDAGYPGASFCSGYKPHMKPAHPSDVAMHQAQRRPSSEQSPASQQRADHAKHPSNMSCSQYSW